MKYAECECRECGLEFKVTFSNGAPDIIHCPKCTGILIKLHWIDRAGFNNEI